MWYGKPLSLLYLYSSMLGFLPLLNQNQGVEVEVGVADAGGGEGERAEEKDLKGTTSNSPPTRNMGGMVSTMTHTTRINNSSSNNSNSNNNNNNNNPNREP